MTEQQTPSARAQRAKELAERATEGPWVLTACADVWVESEPLKIGVAHAGDIEWLGSDRVVNTQEQCEANAALIAESRTLLPALADDVLAGEAQIWGLKVLSKAQAEVNSRLTAQHAADQREIERLKGIIENMYDRHNQGAP